MFALLIMSQRHLQTFLDSLSQTHAGLEQEPSSITVIDVVTTTNALSIYHQNIYGCMYG